MAANFAQMGQQRQTPQQTPGAPNNQLHNAIYQAMSQQTVPIGGWQAQVLIQERVSNVYSLIGSLRLASQQQPNPFPLTKLLEYGTNYEREAFFKSPDRDSYKRELEKKQQSLLAKRAMNQNGLQQQINQQAQVQAQHMMMNQNGQMQRAMLQPPVQQGFHHLQHPMQASQLPGQQNPQMNLGMPNDAQQGMPNQSFQMPVQQPQQQNFPGRPMNGQPQLSQAENELINQHAKNLMSQASIEEKNSLRARIQASVDPVSFQNMQAQNIDPLLMHYKSVSIKQYRENRQNRMAQQQHQQQQHQMATVQGQNMPTSAPMQLQRSMNPSPLNGQAQQPPMNGGQEFMSFTGNNMDNIAVQQQQGVIAQEAGQMVVPASGVSRNNTPQPGMPGQQMNPNARNQQQIFNAQQTQQQRMQHASQPPQSQQQSQLQARQIMQQKAQQMALQGQGLNNGPSSISSQQSPAMAVPNNLLRTPSQQMTQPEAPMNPNAQFGQPLDPRFIQGDQRPINASNGFNLGMFPGMPPEQAQKFAGLPRDKLTEVVANWRKQQMNANGSGRPGMQPQPNSHPRPGQQMPQPGHFTPNGINQFNNANPGQQATPAMLQAISQQQMARLAQNPSQQQNMSQHPGHERAIMQMEQMDFPPVLLSNGTLPRGVPPEIKKWGPLKAWVQHNPALGTELFNKLLQIQRAHYQQIVRRNQPHPNTSMSMQPGPQDQMAAAMHPGMTAPVAPMAQNPMQFAGATRQPSQHDINNLRNHPSGKMLNATDDQIRSLWMRQSAADAQSQLQLRQQQLMQQQLANLSNGQGPGQGMQMPQKSASSPAMPVPQISQPEVAAPALNQPANRAARPQPSARPAAQSSPAPPAKNLKRAGSDDVVEVPNPNQQSRPTAPVQPQRPPGQPAQLSAEQLANLPAEQRAKYEEYMRKVQLVKQQAFTSNTGDLEKMKGFQQQEQAAQVHMADIPMDEKTKALMSRHLKELVAILQNIGRVVMQWYTCIRDDNRARLFFRTQLRVRRQFVDNGMTQPRDNFSMAPKEIEQSRILLQGMIKDLKENFPGLKKPEAAQAPPPAPAPVTAPLNAANLEQQQKQFDMMHQRSNSRSQIPPAAPTTSQPPFQFGTSSPHGTPIYNGKHPAVTQENLHIPRKKQKPNNTPAAAQSTPGSTSSPQIKQAATPDIKKEVKAPAKPALTCSEPECDRHNIGFDSEDALRQHTQQEHIKPLEDPKRFVLETLASMTALDDEGKPKKTAAEEAAGARMVSSGSKQEQTPKDTPAGTPMHRQVSMNRQASAASKTSPQAKGRDLTKDVLAKAQAARDSQQKAAAPVEVIDPWATATIDPNDLAQTFAAFESGAGVAIGEATFYQTNTTNTSPESSKEALTEPLSDITDGVALDVTLSIFDDSWQPFAGGGESSEVNDARTLFALDIDDGNADGLYLMDEAQPMKGFAWDDVIDPGALHGPFSFDTSMYSMNFD